MKQIIDEVKNAGSTGERITVKGLSEKHGMSMPAIMASCMAARISGAQQPAWSAAAAMPCPRKATTISARPSICFTRFMAATIRFDHGPGSSDFNK